VLSFFEINAKIANIKHIQLSKFAINRIKRICKFNSPKFEKPKDKKTNAKPHAKISAHRDNRVFIAARSLHGKIRKYY
jgi:hypothetical protein